MRTMTNIEVKCCPVCKATDITQHSISVECIEHWDTPIYQQKQTYKCNDCCAMFDVRGVREDEQVTR